MKDSGRNVGLRDVARVAGVSTATVSRAMNNPEAVSEELRDRIASVVRHLGWVPHGAARALATRRTGTIGAVFPTLTHGDFARAIQALQSELSEAGYTLLLACSEYDAEQEYPAGPQADRARRRRAAAGRRGASSRPQGAARQEPHPLL